MHVPESDELLLETLGRQIDDWTISWGELVQLMRPVATRAYCPACLDEHANTVCPEAAGAGD